MAHKKDLIAVGIAALTGIGGYMVYKKTAKSGIDSDDAPKLKDMDSAKPKESKLPEDKFEKRRLPEPDVKKTSDAIKDTNAKEA